MTEETIFAAALEKQDPAERRDYLDQACGGDLALRQQVDSLLEAHDQAGGFLRSPAVHPTADPAKDATGAYDRYAGLEPVGSPTEMAGEEADSVLAFLQPSTMPGSLGRLGHFEILEELGRGGFGIVLRALDELLHRVVAIKIMAPPLAATSPARKRFLREARACAAIRHDNVVAIYSVEEQPIPYLVMEFVAGETLQQRLNRVGPLDAADVVRIGRQVAEGLAAAHAQGLIHRDVKPANILLEHGGDRVKITDFGLARAADDASLTHSGIVAGTPMYMAPEQALGDPIDHRADLFSLGSVLYVMCSGRPPFRASTTRAVLKRVADEAARPIQEIIPEVPAWLCALVAKLHAKDPENRFSSAKEVADLLARCVAEPQGPGDAVWLPPPPPASSTLRPADRAVPAAPAAAANPVAARDWKRYAVWSVVVVAGLLAVAVGLGTAGVFKRMTPNGILAVAVDEPNAELYVDGVRFTGPWADGSKTAEVHVRPGLRKVEVKKEGYTPYVEHVALDDGQRAHVVRAHLEPVPKTEWTVGAKGARFASLGDALEAVPEGALIEVLPGVYRENPIVLTKNVEIVARGPRDGVTILCERGTTILSQAEKVLLRGLTLRSVGGSVVSVPQGACRLEDCDLAHFPAQDGSAPHYSDILRAKGERPTVELVGCKVHDTLGESGIHADQARLTAERCTIERTHAQGIGASESDVKLRSCTISATKANNIWVHAHSHLDASDCQFLAGPGGFCSVVATGESEIGLIRCRIADNRDGGLGITNGATASVEDCDVTGNQYGVHVISESENCRRNGWRTLTTATLTNCRVTHNREVGLLMKEDSKAVVTGCDFRGNTGGAWDIAPSCTIQRENTQEDPPAEFRSDGSGEKSVYLSRKGSFAQVPFWRGRSTTGRARPLAGQLTSPPTTPFLEPIMSLPRWPMLLALAAGLSPVTDHVARAQSPAPKRLLIVARMADHKTLQPFVVHKRKLLPTELVALETARKEKGVDDAEKLKKHIYNRWKKDNVGYVLLVGDPEIMPVRYNAVSLIDAKHDSEFVAFAACDLYFSDLAKRDGSFEDWNGNKEGVNAQYFGQLKGLDGKSTINFDGIDYIPDIALGRWPVHTTDQLKAVIAKTINYENRVLGGHLSAIRRTGFVLGTSFDVFRQPMKDWSKQCETALDQPSVMRTSAPDEDIHKGKPIQNEVARMLEIGAGMVFHAGHGNPSQWTGCLDLSQLKSLQNEKLPPVMFSAGCDTAAFAPDPPGEPWVDIHGKKHAGTNHKESRVTFAPAPSNYQGGKFAKTSLGVEFVRSDRGGCVAYIGGSVGTQPGLALPMMRGFIDYTTQHDHPRLGDAWNWGLIKFYHEKKVAALQPTDWVQNAIFHQGMKFVVFGDPSMRLPGRAQPVNLSSDGSQPNLIVNGSFEEGLDWRYDGDMGLQAGSTDLKGWKANNPVLLTGFGWENADGDRSVFLPGKNPRAGVEQTFTTTKGQRYRVSFALSANPNNGRWSADERTTGIELSAAGKYQKFTFDCTGRMPYKMGWGIKEWEFEAEDAKTTLAFSIAEVNGNYWRGPVLDNVRVVAVEVGKTTPAVKK